MAQRVSRAERRRRQREGDRGFVYLRFGAQVPRPSEVAISEAPGPPPSYTFDGDRHLYGLGPPQDRVDCPSARDVVEWLRIIVPNGVDVGAAREWRREGLRFRLDHLDTGTHVDGAVPPPKPGERFDRDILFVVLRDALRRLRAAIDGAARPE